MPGPSRRNVVAGGAALLAGGALSRRAAGQGAIRIRDIVGREVTLARPARRIVLGQGRHLPSLALIDPDPVSLLAGWQRDMQRQDPATYDLYRRKFPALDGVPVLGEGTRESLSIEKALALQPDAVILSLYVAGIAGDGNESRLIRQFESAGIPVIVVDYFNNPLRDTVASIRILGQVIGREREAETFLKLYDEKLSHLRRTLADKKPAPPSVFMHAHAGGFECCYSSGKGTFDDFISLAGGRNIAQGIIPGSTGQISLEYLIAQDPEVYVATGGPHLASSGGFVLGSGVDEETARRRLQQLLAGPGLSGLSAVRSHRAHGLWHMFNDTPAHIVALEWLAKWFHPRLFADIDPASTLQRINDLAAVPFAGTYWIDRP